MKKPTISGIYKTHFSFLETDYHFQVVRKSGQYVTEYFATSPYCQVVVFFVNSFEIPPKVTIEPMGEIRQTLYLNQYSTLMSISEAAYYFDPSLKEPEWWDNQIPLMPVEQQAAYLRMYFGKMLEGDFTEWLAIYEGLQNRRKKRIALYQENVTDSGYEIIERDGCKGLKFNNIPVLPVEYSSIVISNRNSNEYSKKDFSKDLDVCSVTETNFVIISADGKCGLFYGKECRLPMDFARIIKLSYEHYLCQREPDIYSLYNIWNLRSPHVEFAISGEITLGKYLSILETHSPAEFALLGKTLRKENGVYISQYRYYTGCQDFGWDYHDFVIATIEVVINDDFSISEPVHIIKP